MKHDIDWKQIYTSLQERYKRGGAEDEPQQRRDTDEVGTDVCAANESDGNQTKHQQQPEKRRLVDEQNAKESAEDTS